jgi:hypothetical protein
MSRSRKNESGPKKIERTGEQTLNIHHDDGSIFECKVDNPKRFDSIKGCRPKVTSFGGFGDKKELICNKCKERVYKITYVNGQDLCDKCSN